MPSARLADLVGPAGDAFDSLAVTGLTPDSRAVAPGFVFFAIPGVKADGARFVPQALAQGAVAIVAEIPRPEDCPEAVAWRRVPNARLALAHAAAAFHPRQPERIVAVTGTAGKSSVADFVRQIRIALGDQAASLGTLGVVTGEGAEYGALTTPDPVGLHRMLQDLADRGITDLAMEASSHGLDQHRLDGVRLSAAAFTNLGRDHLDYHPTMEAYLAAKMRLFDTLLPRGARAIVNADGDYAREAIDAIRAAGHTPLTVGRDGDFIRLERHETRGFAQAVSLVHAGQRDDLAIPLIGTFQIENALVAAALVIATGGDAARVFAALEGLEGVDGRLERVGEVDGGLCVVDYAHKPDALSHALKALRPFARGRLICIFGCGGDRDPGKRPIMGRIAAQLSDHAIITDDNPRSEDPAAIRTAIAAEAPDAQVIGDRAAAIRAGVDMLSDGDVLVVAGKGHETGQIVGEQTFPFSDQETIRQAIAARRSRS
ncbi:MAG: UDP-N-acetylmuramoyl-L-alanyl-D-glutamate--2,6-diaminopimelate ligase [Salinarimonas sp.]|nr:UDP-N-acetylmuramoyl-L-alanyl-D-glutamate--2,6-diaminopimelate ligase [Salinarimonas sp.]